jgi:predicted nucleic acid-binding protein
MTTEAFFDTNVLLYLLEVDDIKVARALELTRAGGVISVQVLDEIASVTARKHRMSWPEVHLFLQGVRGSLAIIPTNLATHELGLVLAERYRYGVYDAMLLAAALQAGCTTFHSEDLHNGQVIEGALTIRNPFRA